MPIARIDQDPATQPERPDAAAVPIRDLHLSGIPEDDSAARTALAEAVEDARGLVPGATDVIVIVVRPDKANDLLAHIAKASWT